MIHDLAVKIYFALYYLNSVEKVDIENIQLIILQDRPGKPYNNTLKLELLSRYINKVLFH